MTHMKLKYQLIGRHVHVNLSTRPDERDNYIHNGLVIFSKAEWEDIKLGFLNMDAISRMSRGTVRVELIEEGAAA